MFRRRLLRFVGASCWLLTMRRGGADLGISPCAASPFAGTRKEDRFLPTSAKAGAMNLPSDNDPITQQARTFSGRLGNLAAVSSATRPEPAFNQLDANAPLSASLSSILSHLRQRAQRKEHAQDKLRAQEFMT